MAGSPIYLDMLNTFTHIQVIATTLDQIYTDIDRAWDALPVAPEEHHLRYLARVGFEALALETGKEIPDLIIEAKDLHIRKNAGYAGHDQPDPWLNFRLCERFQLSPVQGVLVRMSDKMARIRSLRRSANNEQVGEAIHDTLADLIAYALIAICLMMENDE